MISPIPALFKTLATVPNYHIRHEIPAAMIMTDDWESLSALQAAQHPQGYWEEYSYQKTDEKVGYYGAVTTSFALIALAHAYRHQASDELLRCIIKGSDFLFNQEQRGRFLKSGINRSDVLNTNCLAGIALLEVADCLPLNSHRQQAYRSAAQRSMIRAVKSQFLSGALPYAQYGWHVPYLYHAMTLGLLAYGYERYFPESTLLRQAIVKGWRYFTRYVLEDGSVDWGNEAHPEKSGASWIYGWALIAANVIGDSHYQAILCAKLASLEIDQKGFRNELGDMQLDVFYSAWTVMALSLANRCDATQPQLHASGIMWIHIQGIAKRLAYVIKYVKNRMFKSFYGVHYGPIEHW